MRSRKFHVCNLYRSGNLPFCHFFEKSSNLPRFYTFKAFKDKVELQQRKKIKVVHSDKGGEYYGRYDETRRNPRPFAKYLQECGINA